MIALTLNELLLILGILLSLVKLGAAGGFFAWLLALL